ncbi:coiled-coil domain-containing glutamate-rich protein 2 [Sceloporus undulatus]|uniref:coiled-coil domain-containing glutamate-rich protein 2 n=1 Tax=Sceloporus undulatus TaxID=8520 RepID=UPI001C4C6B9C|nr:coiled-coil domain-containing glutamate-rich protein 2 [Sceloporus undulatus]
MLLGGLSFLLLSLCSALALPLTTQLSEEDERVTRCITEILADTLSRPSPIPVTGECMKILREDERVLAMLHHQHLLNELEELTHQENIKHHLGHEGGRDAWEGEENEQEDVKKRDKKQTLDREAGSEQMREQNAGRKEEEQETKEYEKTEKTEEKVKEEKVSEGQDHHKALEEQVKELMEEEDEEKAEEEEDEARKKKKRRSSSETWSSKEYFGHIKKRGPDQPKIREVMLEENQDDKRNGLIKRHFKVEEEEEDESSEEEPKRYHHRGFNKGRHHENWEDEEEDEEVKKRPSLAKRVAEKASDEETAQFEEQEKGVKVSNSQIHLHGGWKPWQKKEQEEELRHGHHHKQAGLDLKKRHEKDVMYPKDRHHSHSGEEDEREASPDEELKKLEEIEQELKRAAEKLEALKRG